MPRPLAALLVGLCLLAPIARATELVQLTFTGWDENWASWAPDGRTILLSSGEIICGHGEWFCGVQNIWHLEYDQSVGSFNQELLVEDAYHPRISPDGQWVAGMVHNGDDWDIVVWSTLELQNPRSFQSLAGYDERFPNWSNDSQYIAFDSNRPTPTSRKAYHVYYAAIADLEDPDAAVQVTTLGSNNKHPTWNREGTEIAYVGNANDERSISAVRLADGAYREITPHSSQNRHPDWSPDGRWIAFVTDRWDGIGDVAIVRADGGGEPIRITVGMDGHDDFPEWSADSSSLVFCGTAYVPPYRPNKEIFMARDLPTGTVATAEGSVGALKALFGGAAPAPRR